jgi:hypothetical protein
MAKRLLILFCVFILGLICPGCQWLGNVYAPRGITWDVSVVPPTAPAATGIPEAASQGRVVLAEVFTYDE